jgi:hypothetical protein
MMYRSRRVNYLTILVLFIFVALLMAVSLTSAQTPTPQGSPMEITGVVSEVSGSTIVVAGLTIDTSSISLDSTVIVGTTVTVTGLSLANNVVVAQSVVVVVITEPTPGATPSVTPTAGATLSVTPTAEVTPSVTSTPTPSSDVIIVIEGPVINIINNIITIYSFDVELEPTHPFLNLVQVGDFIHVEGAFGNTGVIVATVVSNVTTVTTVGGTVGLDGPVEAINGNVLVVNGISAQLAPNDPLLQTVQVGNFVSLQGNFQGSGTNIILVVVNITIINNVVIDNNPQCWFHDDAMGMGHWHCDGMGMGDAMGMGDDGMGMGMGDEGMGMGMGDAMGMGMGR